MKTRCFALVVFFALFAARQASACTVTSTYNCYGTGGKLTCSGSSCSGGATWVSCDGVRTDCPACDILQDCSWMCPQPYQTASIYCISSVGRCSMGFKWVQCDSDPRIYCESALWQCNGF